MVDDIAAIVAQLSAGALLAKVDIELAYWLIPVHQQDRPLQAIQWDSRTYIDPICSLRASLGPQDLQRSCRCIELVPPAVRNPPRFSLPRQLHY